MENNVPINDGRLDAVEDVQNDGNPKIDEHIENDNCQWSVKSNTFFPVGQVTNKLPSGAYQINHDPNYGICFEKVPVSLDGIIEFPHTNCEEILNEIKSFWNLEDKFMKHSLVYKRGILLWGPPGSGKSCAIKLISKDVINRNGIVINFNHPELFREGILKLRMIEPDTPIVVTMEDIDSTFERFCETDVLNILDGLIDVKKIVYLATTNYPEKLKSRIINRPSRFDRRFKIGHPTSESRRIYLQFLDKDKDFDHDKWVKDTDGFSFSHLKELFVSVKMLGNSYNESLEILKEMKKPIASEPKDEFETNKLGF